MKTPNQYRLKHGPFASDDSFGNNGAFLIQYNNLLFSAIASDGQDWEHVSASLQDRTPTWKEMCFIKDLFWDEDECVIQFHPPKKDYVNMHNNCLHLWKPIGKQIETPPSILVGLK